MQRQLVRSHRLHDRSNSCRSGHVTFHGIHASGGRFEAETAGIVNHSFANQNDRGTDRGISMFVFHDREGRRSHRTLVDGQ